MTRIEFPTLGFDAKFADEPDLIRNIVEAADISPDTRRAITARAVDLVTRIRTQAKPTLMEHFLAEYGLSTREGVALMCLAEAMLRVPDSFTMDALIEDKIAPSAWNRHLGSAASSLVNASTWALMLTGKVLDDDQPGVAGVMRGALKRLGEPVIRAAVGRAMKEMGRQFVLGETIDGALARGAAQEAKGYTYSFDMLGEAARTQADATRYARDYANAIAAIGRHAKHTAIVDNPGISIKLSALHPRYEVPQEDRVMAELVPVVRDLARQAKKVGIALHIDAEEQDRLTLSFKVIAAVIADPALAGWDGFGVVVQAYGKRAGAAIDALYTLAQTHDRKINVRLVKGAYWDTEMKLAQVAGMPDFPLFTSKTATDVAYICLAKKLFGMGDRIFPQFATHNAHSVAAILEMAQDRPFEFQRLHGMGERLHEIVLKQSKGHCRIYAPVGAHRDLLAYLVRRLLENGANSSFVHQIVDETVQPEDIAADPFNSLGHAAAPVGLVAPMAIYGADRVNARGWDVFDDGELAAIAQARDIAIPDAAPMTVSPPTGTPQPVVNPATGTIIAKVIEADHDTVGRALDDAALWTAPPAERAEVLRRAADMFEAHFGPIFAILGKEAGKSIPDAVGELREAVDFLRYYAQQGLTDSRPPRGIIAAISPWNFPLAIFTGQIAAALMAGNAVLAKPAEQTPIIASFAVDLLHRAGVPKAALQLLPGAGHVVGAAITSDSRVAGVVFTGSTATARVITRSMAMHMAPGTPLIAETGGLNAMVVDSTALPEQAVRDILASSFQSAGQRCSALRCLYLQKDNAPHVIEMIKGAMDELRMGDPWDLATDVGPVIDAAARDGITDYIAAHHDGLLHQTGRGASHTWSSADRTGGTFIPPTLIKIDGIGDLDREIFGPVLHVAVYEARDLDQVIADVNAKGFGLTFGLHSRIDDRVQSVSESIQAGNIYINRNQIGAIVGSQPFGGEGLSGTGPKAGGPMYLNRFYAPETAPIAPPIAIPSVPLSAPLSAPLSMPPSLAPSVAPDVPPSAAAHDLMSHGLDHATLRAVIQKDAAQRRASSGVVGAQAPVHRLGDELMPGPTGELNRLTLYTRPPVLCLGPGADLAHQQAEAVRALGGQALVLPDPVQATALPGLDAISAVIWWGDASSGRDYAIALAKGVSETAPGAGASADAPIIPLITAYPDRAYVVHERHLCVDTTAAGGNAALLAG